jgi:large subunit ribosomal protein L24e
VVAMKRVQEIKQKREAQFIKNRLNATKDQELQRDLKAVQLDVGLLQNPPVSRKQMAAKAASEAASKEDADAMDE